MADTRKTPDAPERPGPDLHKVNDKLRELVASLRTEKERLVAAESRAAPALTPAPGGDPAAEAVDLEKKRLAAELALAREAVEHANAERERLRARLAELEAENQRISDEYVAVQERSTDLAQLYVALERIHAGLSRGETLSALQEIVINMVGCEELAIFERQRDALALVQSFGVDPEPLRRLPLDAGAIARAVSSGKLYVAGREGPPAPGEENLTAAIPLRVGREVVGAVAIYRLLGHRPGLGESDQAVFDLLSAHAGLALHLRGALERPSAA